MISDKERAIIESAAAEINPDEVPGKDFLDELITAAKGGPGSGGHYQGFYVRLFEGADGSPGQRAAYRAYKLRRSKLILLYVCDIIQIAV